MKRIASGLLAGATVAAMAAGIGQPATAVPADDSPPQSSSAGQHRPDNRPGPLTEQHDAMRRAAVERLAQGTATLNPQPDGGATVQLADDRFVEFPAERSDRIFTILAEFGDQSAGRYGTTPGPLHNEIAEPDRTVDNSTKWTADFDPAYYLDMFNGSGESMKTYYEDLSSGRYTVTNEVSEWVTVPYNASYYGDNAREDVGGAWDFIKDAGNAWYEAQLAASKTPAEIDAYLSQFDVWDRYDFDGDGNFTEPDGYIDHFQAVHAGIGEDAGGGAQGADAIWSHRWYVNGSDFGVAGPTVGSTENLSGGARIGQSTYWLGDYTTEPENGGLGVFTHEFGHDLGLPDYYDTNGGENGTGFWTLMSSGSWLGHGAEANEGIGDAPGLMGPEEKLFLGWLDYTRVEPGQSGSYTLNPSQGTVDGADQAVLINLPEKWSETTYTTPTSGRNAWWTGSADGLNETLTREIPAASRVTVTARAWYDIEANFDYLYGEYSLDGGQTWTRTGNPVDGASNGRWTTLRYSYAAGDQPSVFRFRYQTDGGVHNPGAFLDDITVKSGGTTLFSDDVESGVNGWTATGGWEISTGTVGGSSPQYYLVENREYIGWDDVLRTGAYQFSSGLTKPDWVEYFSYQNGMLVWYVDYSYEDNNTSLHPGGGAALPVDARPARFSYDDGTSPSNRRQPFDATFGLETTDEVCLHKEVLDGNGKSQTVVAKAACAASTPGVPTFDDSVADAYWNAANPGHSTKVAGHGVSVTVTDDTGNDLQIQVVNPAP